MMFTPEDNGHLRSTTTPLSSSHPAPSQRLRHHHTVADMYEHLLMGIIRPPRLSYSSENLGPPTVNFSDGSHVHRQDFQLTNSRGYLLECSLWRRLGRDDASATWPCVIYLHGNASARVEAVRSMVFKAVMAANASLVSFDFSGCGHSQGDYVSLGWFEEQDTRQIIKYVRSLGAGPILLWGRSMGAVAALLYEYNSSKMEDSIQGLILDSPFTAFKALAYDLTSNDLVHIPKPATSFILSLLRRSVKKRAGFDLYRLAPKDQANKQKRPLPPALFLVADGDGLIPPWHAEELEEGYPGLSVGLRFEGDHNSSRSLVVYTLATLFINSILHRPSTFFSFSSFSTIDMAIHLIKDTAAISYQDDLEEEQMGERRSKRSSFLSSRQRRFRRRRGKRRSQFASNNEQPRFIQTGRYSISNLDSVSRGLMTTLDVNLACRAAEDYLFEEILNICITYIQMQLSVMTSRQKCGDTGVMTPSPRSEYYSISKIDECLDGIIETQRRFMELHLRNDNTKAALSWWNSWLYLKKDTTDIGEDWERILRNETEHEISQQVHADNEKIINSLMEAKTRGNIEHYSNITGKLCCFDMNQVYISQRNDRQLLKMANLLLE